MNLEENATMMNALGNMLGTSLIKMRIKISTMILIVPV
jgi:hypothetical protein